VKRIPWLLFAAANVFAAAVNTSANFRLVQHSQVQIQQARLRAIPEDKEFLKQLFPEN
jgi:type II secretory pathway component PulL